MSKSHTEEYLRTRATQIVEEKVKGSTLFDDKAEEKVPRFSPSGKTWADADSHHVFAVWGDESSLILDQTCVG
jgi:hypothetical protein